MLIHEMFIQVAAVHPERVAVSMGQSLMTFAELDTTSSKVAHALISQGVLPGDVVGLCMKRSPDLIAALIGILKAGAAYLPLDSAYPRERLHTMMSLARIKTALINEGLSGLISPQVKSLKYETLNWNRLPGSCPHVARKLIGPAYVIYTSGSTGTPKGVTMGHGALVNLLEWQNEQTIYKETVTLQFTPVSFDVHFQEIFSTLTMGGKLVLVSEDDRLDPARLLHILNEEKVNRLFLPFVALSHLCETAGSLGIFPRSLKEVITAGEQLKITSAIRKFFYHLGEGMLYNHYGPSETHVVTSHTLSGNSDHWPALPPIGKPIKNCEALMLDAELNPVNKGEKGELYFKGICLAEGYLNASELTQERFIHNPHLGRIYKTGDVGHLDEHDDIIFDGRSDNQVKIRGYRIEKGEVELKIMDCPGVDEAVVTVRTGAGGDLLCGYFTGKALPQTVREWLREKLPDYMVPAHLLKVDSLLLTPSGKVDYRNLPSPSKERPDLNVPFRSPETSLQEDMCRSWMKFLDLEKVGIDDGFFDLGGNSLLALKFMVEFNQSSALKISILNLFNYPTIFALSSFLEGGVHSRKVKMKVDRSFDKDEHEIAVIAMTGRFPGAKNLDEFWQNLEQGKSSLELFPLEEVHPDLPESVVRDENFVPVTAEMPGQKYFDCRLFGITPREAELMDPQQRKFLELGLEALELAGYDPDKYEGAIGTFAGMGNGLYAKLVASHPEKVKDAGEFNVMLGLEKDYIATRAAFKLNLKGPALSIHTGCSTSLIAIIEAANSLRNHDCDMALAGGISISGAPKRGHLFQEGGILSRDGQCRPFDESATGTVFSDGGGVVVLKRLKDAKNDGDNVLAVVKGLGINNDGGGKMSFTAPSIDGQIDVISRALADAGVEPRTISYVEAHGTATPVGDPIEVEALTRAFRQTTQDRNFCFLSSVKSNIGHLTAAAGVAAFIKVVLSLKKGVLPGTVHFKTPNKLLGLEHSPFIVTNEARPFPESEHPRRASISSFGVGGTNGHVIIEEFKDQYNPAASTSHRQLLFKLSARSESQLQMMRERLLSQLQTEDLSQWPKIAFTLETGRKEFEHRGFFLAKDKKTLTDLRPSNCGSNLMQRERSLYFLFPGQGAQYPGMGKGLYESSPLFAAYFDNCCEILSRHMPYDLKAILFESYKKDDLNNTYYTQPAIFIIEYCLARTLMDLGLTPRGLLGHSIGEYAAATLAGVFTLEDGLRVIAKRAEFIKDLPPGVMLSVAVTHQKVKDLIQDDPIDVAVINGPEACVVAGESGVIEAFKQRLSELGIASMVLSTSHAFHSRAMGPAVGMLKKFLDTIPMQTPSIPVCSSVTGRWEKELLCRPDYWASHIENCVSFSSATACFTQDKHGFYLEVGPRNVLTNLLKKQWFVDALQGPRAQSLLSDGPELESRGLSKGLGDLWLHGIKVKRPELIYLPEERRKVPTTTYAFLEQEVWLDHPQQKNKVQQTIHTTEVIKMETGKKKELIKKLTDLFESSSGIDVSAFGPETSFSEMGMDSLFLTQIALKIKKEFKVNITFRQMLEDYSSLDLLADTLMKNWAYEETKVAVEIPVNTLATRPACNSGIEELISRQLELMNQQLNLLKGGGTPTAVQEPVAQKKRGHDIKKSKDAFGPAARIVVEKSSHLSPLQSRMVQDFVAKYNAKTAKSKKFTQDHRKNHADPRVVTGFRPESKEIIYPIVVNRSSGQKLWDLDGNEYIDMICGFGSNFFGNGNERIKAAVIKQINEGIEVGPQHPLVADVSCLVNELTGNERTAFCNTGSEAVLGAMRLARTVTGRDKIIVFSGSYHGINDEVIIRGSKQRPFPAAPGINEAAVSNMIVLDYGTEESLQTIRAMASDVAAILVEPVQSRRCNFHPVEFLKEVRKITQVSQTCLIFDEVITGFRIHPGGAQAHFGIPADLCTYGKIIGGGMPIGVISGRSEYMDALDGGHWEFGNDSTPTVGVTYFAGTFVRHPLALAAARASLEIIKEGGEKQLRELNERAQKFVDEINLSCQLMNVPLEMNNFGTLMKPKWKTEVPGGEYLFALLRYHGVHSYDGFPWFVNLAHTDEQLSRVLEVIKESLAEMQEMGLFPESRTLNAPKLFDPHSAPVEGAKLGRDELGNPAWFIERAGEFYKVEA